MPWYPKATRRELPQNKTARPISPRSIALHTGVTNGTSLYSFFNGRSQGVESHFYVREDGAIEQYMDTSKRADCQLDGNSYAISIETWDGAGRVWDGRNVNRIPEWNTKQVAALVDLMAWICRTHNIPAAKCPAWDGRGIGYHAQFTGGQRRWNEHHACPGPARIRQVPDLIAKTKAALAGPARPAPEDDLDANQAKQLAAVAADAEKNDERYRDTMKAIQTWGGRVQREVDTRVAESEERLQKAAKFTDDKVDALTQRLDALTDQIQALAHLVKGPQA